MAWYKVTLSNGANGVFQGTSVADAQTKAQLAINQIAAANATWGTPPTIKTVVLVNGNFVNGQAV